MGLSSHEGPLRDIKTLTGLYFIQEDPRKEEPYITVIFTPTNTDRHTKKAKTNKNLRHRQNDRFRAERASS